MTEAIRSGALAEGLAALGLSNAPKVIDQFERYAELLLKWNRVYNLTAIREAEDVLTHHLLDAASMVPMIAKHAPQAKTVLDVGSGGGLPAVPIAILCPALSVRAVDAVGKKTAFINQVAIELGLKNLRAEHVRVEKMKGDFDVITSRAFSSLKDFTTLSRGLLAPGGCWLAMKGGMVDNEAAELPDGVLVCGVEPLTVPGLEEERHLYVLREG